MSRERFIPYRQFHGSYLPNCLLQYKEISSLSKLCWARLSQYAGEDGHCFPKQDTLSKELGVSVSAVKRSLQELEDNGFIEIDRPDNIEKSQHRQNKYYFLLHECLKLKVNSRDSRLSTSHIKEDNINDEHSTKVECLVGKPTRADALPQDEVRLKRRKLNSNAERIRSAIKSAKNQEQTFQTYEQPPPNLTEPVEEIFNYWRENKFKLPAETTKSYKKAIRKVNGLLRGTLFKKKFSVDDIKLGITKLNMMAFDDLYEPSKPAAKQYLQKLSLVNFIDNKFSTNGDRSLFLKYKDSEPRPIRNLIKDEYPVDTNTFKIVFTEKFLRGKQRQWSPHEENCFRLAAIKMHDFMKVNGKYCDGWLMQTTRKIAIELCEALKENTNTTITPGFLSSDKTWDYKFPQYLERLAIMHD